MADPLNFSCLANSTFHQVVRYRACRAAAIAHSAEEWKQ